MAIPKNSALQLRYNQSTFTDDALIIFIKQLDGDVKTRLAKDIGSANARLVYKHLTAHTRDVASTVNATRMLFYNERVLLRDAWPEDLYLKFEQQGADLGEKMSRALAKAFALGHSHVVIIGSDCLELTADIVAEAFERLKTADFVLGPAKDGGYYLLGMNEHEDRIFQKKAWSTANVARDTLKDISDLGKTCHLLPVLSDVDTVADLNAELNAIFNR